MANGRVQSRLHCIEAKSNASCASPDAKLPPTAPRSREWAVIAARPPFMLHRACEVNLRRVLVAADDIVQHPVNGGLAHALVGIAIKGGRADYVVVKLEKFRFLARREPRELRSPPLSVKRCFPSLHDDEIIRLSRLQLLGVDCFQAGLLADELRGRLGRAPLAAEDQPGACMQRVCWCAIPCLCRRTDK